MAANLIELGMAIQRMQDEFSGVSTLTEHLRVVLNSANQSLVRDPSRSEEIIAASTKSLQDITDRFRSFKSGAEAALDQLEASVGGSAETQDETEREVAVGTLTSGTRFRAPNGRVYTVTGERRDADTPGDQWSGGVMATNGSGRKVNFDPTVSVEVVE